MVGIVEAAKPMRADARRNVDKLVTAAREAFAERGSETSMEDVARRAGVGVGTLYRHFPKRIDLVEAVYAIDIDTLVAAAAAADTLTDAWQALTDWLYAYVRYVESKRTFLTELHEAFEKNPELRSVIRERVQGAAAKVLARAQESGAARRDVSAGDIMQLVGGMCMSATAVPGQNERLLSVVLAGVKQA